MDAILFMSSNRIVRQLYHGLLFSKNIEIVPVESMSDATVLLMLNPYFRIIMHVSPEEKDQTKLFLNLRNRHHKLSQTKLILLTDNVNVYSGLIIAKDYILNTSALTPKEITKKIKELIKTDR